MNNTLPIRLFIEPVLHAPCELVIDFSNLSEIVELMLLTMDANRGIGLAANQVGIPKQICVINLENKTKLMGLVNPRIIRYSKDKAIELEGCLSAPGISVNVKRPLWVEAEAQLLSGEKVSYRFEGFDCRVFMHEYFHLQGRMITDDVKNIVRK